MKKILFSLLMFAFTLTTGCELLDTYPKDKISSATFWKSQEDVKMALGGVYSKTRASAYLGQLKPYMDCLTDVGYCWQSAHSSFGAMQSGSLNASTGGVVNSIYNGAYKGIAACNLFLENFEANKETLKYKAEESNLIIAEVRFLRAYFLFELVQRWGGVVVYDKTPTIADSKVAKRTKEWCMQYISEDLKFAEILPNKVYAGRITKNSVYGLQARIALYNKNWDEVIKLTQAIMSSNTTELSDDYTSIYIKRLGQAGCDEILFSVQYKHPDIIPGEGIELQGFAWSGVTPFASFIEKHEAGDKRVAEWYYKAAKGGDYIRPNGELYSPTNSTKTDWGLVKFYDTTNPDKFPLDVRSIKTDDDSVVIRYSEILLMYAEAMVEKGGGSTSDAAAIDAINDIRTRAGLTSYSGVITRDQVRKERMVELAFEGFRLFDLHRWNTAVEVINAIDEKVTGGCSFEPHFYMWPFPQSDLDINEQLEQNTDY